jgi:hypothetical protein
VLDCSVDDDDAVVANSITDKVSWTCDLDDQLVVEGFAGGFVDDNGTVVHADDTFSIVVIMNADIESHEIKIIPEEFYIFFT